MLQEYYKLLSDNLKIIPRLLQNYFKTTNDFKTTLRLIKDSYKEYFKTISMIKKDYLKNPFRQCQQFFKATLRQL